MSTELLADGVQLMIAGMGAVFVFLTLLVLATALMSRVVLRFQPVAAGGEVSEDEVAAITAAIAEHRRVECIARKRLHGAVRRQSELARPAPGSLIDSHACLQPAV